MHENLKFCKRIVASETSGPVNKAWAMGWLNGAGCSGYRMRPRLLAEARQAYRDGQEQGRIAKELAS